MAKPNDVRWLLLIHQLPPKPSYFRVKIWRRLQRLGAVAIKNSVYALPKNEQTQEDFQWVRREILQGGAEATICEAHFVEGLDDREIEALFRAARDVDYREVAVSARDLAKSLGANDRPSKDGRPNPEVELERLKQRVAEIGTIDFFSARGRKAAEESVAALETQLQGGVSVLETRKMARARRGEFGNRTWVTRKGVFVDRMASAWLIRRFIDPRARFKFVADRGYRPQKNEVRFDMFEAEFTHEGDRCTFEVLVERFGLNEPALRPLTEIVHDIDLKDSKFGRKDALGFEQLMTGIATAHKKDEVRLERSAAVLDDLYEYFQRKASKRRRP
ncbi:MAG: chromate resistance protein [Planctomycetes bacterium]|nr:chromate resistance protein [Planctomycetota bacterium]MBI3843211.1 chromate resistance protein [Planctomycetota bacterium]